MCHVGSRPLAWQLLPASGQRPTLVESRDSKGDHQQRVNDVLQRRGRVCTRWRRAGRCCSRDGGGTGWERANQATRRRASVER